MRRYEGKFSSSDSRYKSDVTKMNFSLSVALSLLVLSFVQGKLDTFMLTSVEGTVVIYLRAKALYHSIYIYLAKQQKWGEAISFLGV